MRVLNVAGYLTKSRLVIAFYLVGERNCYSFHSIGSDGDSSWKVAFLARLHTEKGNSKGRQKLSLRKGKKR